MDRFQRIFQLNRILQSSATPVSRRRLEDELECSRATVGRAIEDLRDFLGAPIRYDRALNGYYYDRRERPMYQLPGVWFDPDELFALLSAQQLLSTLQPGFLDSALAPLRRRIEELLQHDQAGGAQLLRRIRVLRSAARPASEFFQEVAGAVAKRRRIWVVYYHRARDQEVERELSPQRLVHYRDNWYLEAWCHLRDAPRRFAMDAARRVRVLETTAIDMAETELDAEFASAYGIFSGPADQVAVLRFGPEPARWVSEESWHCDQVGAFLPDGCYELRVPYGDSRELVRDILRFGADVEVIEPLPLREIVAVELQRAASIYRTGLGQVIPSACS